MSYFFVKKRKKKTPFADRLISVVWVGPSHLFITQLQSQGTKNRMNS